jgi:hypothetical protein
MRKPLSRDKPSLDSIKLPRGFNDGRDVLVKPEDVYF